MMIKKRSKFHFKQQTGMIMHQSELSRYHDSQKIIFIGKPEKVPRTPLIITKALVPSMKCAVKLDPPPDYLPVRLDLFSHKGLNNSSRPNIRREKTYSSCPIEK